MNQVFTETVKLGGSFADSAAVWNTYLQVLNALPATTILASVYHPFPGGGFSGAVIIGESHAAIHTWPENSTAYAVLSSCAGPEVLAEFISRLSEHWSVSSGHWFDEHCIPGISTRLELTGPVLSQKSPHQLVQFGTGTLVGRFLALDQIIQTTALDEWAYHEMLVHVPLLHHPNPERVLVIGGGDGGAARAVLTHKPVKTLLHIEIDETVVNGCRVLFPHTWEALEQDSRYKLMVGDGLAFVRDCSPDQFDVAILDLTDPVGPARALFDDPFYRDLRRVLAPGGLFSEQVGSPFFQADQIDETAKRMRRLFYEHRFYLGAVPTYPGGLHAFVLAGNAAISSFEQIAVSIAEFVRKQSLNYYNAGVHQAAFCLPAFMQAMVE